MAINELELRKILEAIKRKLQVHEGLIKQLCAVTKKSLDISETLNRLMPTDKDLYARQTARKQLSKAEKPVYDLMFTRSNKEIAEKLRLSVHTVKTHIKHIRQKLQDDITRGRKEKYNKDAL
jgi:DNA-binding CsgD family transcriptional regulator